MLLKAWLKQVFLGSSVIKLPTFWNSLDVERPFMMSYTSNALGFGTEHSICLHECVSGLLIENSVLWVGVICVRVRNKWRVRSTKENRN